MQLCWKWTPHKRATFTTLLTELERVIAKYDVPSPVVSKYFTTSTHWLVFAKTNNNILTIFWNFLGSLFFSFGYTNLKKIFFFSHAVICKKSNGRIALRNFYELANFYLLLIVLYQRLYIEIKAEGSNCRGIAGGFSYFVKFDTMANKI